VVGFASIVTRSLPVFILILLASAPVFPLVLSVMPSSKGSSVPEFPRYAITTFAVSADVIDQEAKLLEQVGAYNVTIVYRELDKVALVHEKLSGYGDSLIPELSFMQRHEPKNRAGDVDRWFGALKVATGKSPLGFFSFQVDTFTANYASDRYGATFAIGNAWDQVNMDFMSMRGGLALPYYASRRHSLVPASDQDDSSVLVIQPFAIAPADTYHYDNNHIVDLYYQGVGLDEFNYVSLNYPFYTPFFLELDWVIKLHSTQALENFVQAYKWVYKTFKVVTAEEFTRIFRSRFTGTPEYHFTYKSSSLPSFPETVGRTIEWLMTPQARIARVNNNVVTALDYGRQDADPYLEAYKSIDFHGFRFGEDPNNIIDTSLRFDVDDLWQHEYGDRTLTRSGYAPYLGDLHDFYSRMQVPSMCVDASKCSLEFYRVKLLVNTTSDWTTVRILSGASPAAAKLTVLEGDKAPNLQYSYDLGLGVLAQVKKKKDDRTRVLIEALATMTDLSTDVFILVDKGALGVTSVSLYNQNGNDSVAVSTFENKRSSAESNLESYLIHGHDLMTGGPQIVSRYLRHRLVLAFYYPWYTTSDWTTMRDSPLVGPYSSSEDETISRHIKLAKSAGIDGFIVSWWGPHSPTDDNFRHILARAEELNFQITIYHENSMSFPRTPSSYLSDLKYVLDAYSKSPAFLKLDGTPVVFTYLANVMSVEDYRDVKAKIEQAGYKLVNIADTLDLQYLDVFDGLHTYGTGGAAGLGDELPSTYRSLSRAVKSWSLLNGTGGRRIWAATISPGWDLRNSIGFPNIFQPREEGGYYNSTYSAAVESEPDWILITSFNEWWENTEIEPSKAYGYQYIDLTTAYTSEFKQTTFLPLLRISRTLTVNDQVGKLHITIRNIGNGSAINMITEDPVLDGKENTTRTLDRLLPDDEVSYDVLFPVPLLQAAVNVPEGKVTVKDSYGRLYEVATNPVMWRADYTQLYVLTGVVTALILLLAATGIYLKRRRSRHDETDSAMGSDTRIVTCHT